MHKTFYGVEWFGMTFWLAKVIFSEFLPPTGEYSESYQLSKVTSHMRGLKNLEMEYLQKVAIERTFSPISNGRKIPLRKIKLFCFMPTLYSQQSEFFSKHIHHLKFCSFLNKAKCGLIRNEICSMILIV
jgi:hypothetical protein